MNTKTDGISSGLVAVAEVGAGFSLRWTEPDYGCSCKHYDKLVRLSDAEAIIAQKDAEILEQCRINGMGAEREIALLGQIERQSAALKLAKDALQTLGQYYAWLNFGECRTYGEHVPIVDMRLADLICKEALAAIDSLQEGE